MKGNVHVRFGIGGGGGDSTADHNEDDTVRIWEATTGRCTHILQGHTAEITAVSISEDGRWIVSGSKDNTVQYWNAVTGDRMQVFRNFSHSAKRFV